LVILRQTLLVLLYPLIFVEVDSWLVVGGRVVDIFAEVLLLYLVVAVVDQLLQFFTIRQQAFPTVELYVARRKDSHGLHHLVEVPEVDEESAFRVDEVVMNSNRNLPE
jgi:hypothetical protein